MISYELDFFLIRRCGSVGLQLQWIKFSNQEASSVLILLELERIAELNEILKFEYIYTLNSVFVYPKLDK